MMFHACTLRPFLFLYKTSFKRIVHFLFHISGQCVSQDEKFQTHCPLERRNFTGITQKSHRNQFNFIGKTQEPAIQRSPRPLVIFLNNFYGGIHNIGISKDLMRFNHVFHGSCRNISCKMEPFKIPISFPLF
jgi:hypothetical protein